jgi:hypothetical protein
MKQTTKVSFMPSLSYSERLLILFRAVVNSCAASNRVLPHIPDFAVLAPFPKGNRGSGCACIDLA